MSTILDDLPGVICLVDDILVFRACQEEHYQRLQAVLQRLASAGLTLDGEKCLFSVSQLRFCGYLIGKDGIRPDPAKVTALTEMPACNDVHDIRRFLGLANQLGRFSPYLASLSQPLRDLLVKTNSCCWTESHQTAFDRIKAEALSYRVQRGSSCCSLSHLLLLTSPNTTWFQKWDQSRTQQPTSAGALLSEL